MADYPTAARISHEECVAAYQQVVAAFGFAPVVRPGRIKLLGWDLDYVCGAALPNFIDQILIRRLNDFNPDNDRPVILDCGANIGFGVLNYKRQFPNARIVAFEPDPAFLPALRSNLERNGAADVQVVDAAVWIRSGNAPWLSEGIDGSKIVADGEAGQQTGVVPAIDFADFLRTEVDLVKLDIEGAEYEVVLHLADKGKLSLVKNMVVECHLVQSSVALFARMLHALVEAGFQIGINSMGQWRDLTRQPEVRPNHFGQYFAVSAWRRAGGSQAPAEHWCLPYVGIVQLLQERQLQQAREDLQSARSDLERLRGDLRQRQSELEEVKGELAGYRRLDSRFPRLVRLMNLLLNRTAKSQ